VAVALEEEDLIVDGVGLDVDADRAGHVLVAQARRPADVHEGIGLAVETLDALARETVAAVPDEVPEGPAALKPQPRQRPAEEGDPVGAISDHAPDPGSIGRRRRVLDVVDVVAEARQTDDVVDRLPSDPTHRVLAGEMEDEDAPTGRQAGPPARD